ncbi:MAG: hypothetical protein IV100_00515 [Myxococcales bacterium]|nr:hypothetical protein [Myxococcales bacterium]
MDDDLADVASAPDISADSEAVSDLPSVVPDSRPDADLAPDGSASDVLGETSDVAAEEDAITIDPCDVPGVPPEAVRCYDPPVYGAMVVGKELIAMRYPSENEGDVVLIRDDGVIIDELAVPIDDLWNLIPCGTSLCALSYAWDETEIRISSREISVQDSQLVAAAPSMPLVLPPTSGVRSMTSGEAPALLVGNSDSPWQRCLLGALPTCEEIPVPVECLDGEFRYPMHAVDGPTSTIIAGQCEYPNVAASGIGRPFVFEWERGTGVTWTTHPGAWVGLSSLRLYPDATGFSVVALQLPHGGSDDGGSPMGLSLSHVGTDGAPGDVWNSPLTDGFNFSATAAVRGGDLLVAWTGPSGESSSEVRLTFTAAQGTPTTTTIAPIGYQPGYVAAFGEGYVLGLSGRLVRLDAAGVPVAWPAPP